MDHVGSSQVHTKYSYGLGIGPWPNKENERGGLCGPLVKIVMLCSDLIFIIWIVRDFW